MPGLGSRRHGDQPRLLLTGCFGVCLQSAEAEPTWVEELMWFHQSRVRDVEWAAGLDFYQDSGRPIAELLRVKTRPTAAIHRKP